MKSIFTKLRQLRVNYLTKKRAKLNRKRKAYKRYLDSLKQQGIYEKNETKN